MGFLVDGNEYNFCLKLKFENENTSSIKSASS